MIDPGLSGKVALITGANSGIGAVVARTLAGEGARVMIHYLTGEATARRLAEELRGEATQADLADPAAIPALFDAAEQALGPVAILVNNAAHWEAPEPLGSLTSGAIDRHLAVNTRAPALLMAEFARRFSRHRLQAGRIVNISTDAAQAFATEISYGASKAALEALTRGAAIEAGPLGITVNAIAPGPIQTGWISAELERRLLPLIPLGRLGTPQDIADAVLWLVSEQAAWITGQVIRVCGGHVV